MNFELSFFLNNLLFLLVQTQIKKEKKRKSKKANENRLTANYFWSVLMCIHSLVRVYFQDLKHWEDKQKKKRQKKTTNKWLKKE